MKKILPVAQPKDYIKDGAHYYLSGDGFLALPGCVTSDPEKGAQKYNDCLVNQYMAESDMKERVINLLVRYNKNHRIIKLRTFIKSGLPFNSLELSKTEKFLMNQILSFGTGLLNRQLT